MNRHQYVLISPCRDEAAYMRKTLNCVLSQSIPPAHWVIVDDGSTDNTPVILAEYAAKHPCIRIVRRENRGRRSVGPGVVDAFYAGYETISPDDFEYVCKLDLDLDLPPRYFETLIQRMEADPRLGTCSGKAYFRHVRTGQLISEKCGDEMSQGMTKLYRRECFEEIGGFVRQVMWDGIDGHRCRMLGWGACSWDEPDLCFIHLRPMGASQKGILTGRMRHGFGQYFMGTGLAYMTASSIFRLPHPPMVLGAMAMWWGYIKAALTRVPRYDDPEFRRFLRRYQMSCLLRGKRAATAMLDAKQASVWETHHPKKPDAADSRSASVAAEYS